MTQVASKSTNRTRGCNPRNTGTGGRDSLNTALPPVFLFHTETMKRKTEAPLRSRRAILQERGYKQFELRDRETGEIVYSCWAQNRRNAVRQWRYRRKQEEKGTKRNQKENE